MMPTKYVYNDLEIENHGFKVFDYGNLKGMARVSITKDVLRSSELTP